MSNQLWTVIQFEVTRTLKKPSFWLLTMIMPIMIVGFSILGSLGGQSVANSTQITPDSGKVFYYQDHSGIVDEAVAKSYGALKTDDINQYEDRVIKGEIDGTLLFPTDLVKGQVEIKAKDIGLFSNIAYSDLATSIVKQSIAESIGDDSKIELLRGSVGSTTITFKDGVQAKGFQDAIAPGIFLILFYFSIVLLGNQMLNATIEEKENRVTEMILTSMNPMKLLLGKVGGLFILGIVQVVLLVTVVLAMAAIATFFIPAAPVGGPDQAKLEAAVQGMQLGGIPIDVIRTVLAAGLFASAFILTSGLLTMTGAMVSNAKDAGQVFGFVIMGLMLPYVAFLLIVNDPSSWVTISLTWFPLTSPITVMIRNAVGNMPVLEVLFALAIQLGVGLFFFNIGARLFGAGALAYQGMGIKQAWATLTNRQ